MKSEWMKQCQMKLKKLDFLFRKKRRYTAYKKTAPKAWARIKLLEVTQGDKSGST